ncbi:MAG: GMC family oxidoreductase [Proteobacteria bacterium]|nr:GMC family oxidoreductase [Pseudomonadota bacterium]
MSGVDLAIVGSGYAGSVIAARLAAQGRVVLIERGRRWPPGSFPTTLAGVARARMSRRNPLGLWAMRLGAGTGNALVSGYGGASLVNYGITARPEPRVFEAWAVSAAELGPYLDRAWSVLAPEPNPLAGALGDQAFLDRLEPGRRVELENTIDWRLCTQCGCCVPGCNLGAKRSLDFSYLPLAERGGAEVLTETEVVHLRPDRERGWVLTLRPTVGGAEASLHARQVVLAAGTFGTLELLKRSATAVPTSAAFGQRMSMNGDGLAFLYNTALPLAGEHGAPITTSVRLPFVDAGGTARTLTVMSGRVPALARGPAARVLALLAGALPGGALGAAAADDPWWRRVQRRLRDAAGVAAEGALAHSFMYKLDAEDSGRGWACFDAQGRAAIDWPDYAEDPILCFAAERLEHWARVVGGTVVRNVGSWPGMRSFGVHPLGGCSLGATSQTGVVDPRLRVFQPSGAVYQGLRIVDASVFPTALGVPPSLTVAALAERAAADLAYCARGGD